MLQVLLDHLAIRRSRAVVRSDDPVEDILAPPTERRGSHIVDLCEVHADDMYHDEHAVFHNSLAFQFENDSDFLVDCADNKIQIDVDRPKGAHAVQILLLGHSKMP